MTDLLFELGTEELPPRSLNRLQTTLGELAEAGLKAAKLNFQSIETFATPRRLAVIVRELSERQPDQVVEKRGPAIKAAYDSDGNATKAAIGFARSCGVTLEQLTTLSTPKGDYLLYTSDVHGKSCQTLIPEILVSALSQLPIDKRMRWGSSRIEFVRPVHWVVLLYGNEVIDTEILGITSSNRSQGHRFMSSGEIKIDSPNDYVVSLKREHVVVSFPERRDLIENQLVNIAAELNRTLTIDPELLDEVTALVEWPVTLAGKFDDRFLQVPEEALISAMKEHQKYFHLTNDKGQLCSDFALVSNLESLHPEEVVGGNERVIRPRLKDAEFFFKKDSEQSSEQRLHRLSQVVFQAELGSYHDKARRISELAGYIAGQLNTSVEDALRAGLLCKTDLVSDMVGEFPDLQGIMGGYYARHDGESSAIVTAIQQHYTPAFSGDSIPKELVSACVALADRIDNLVGLFGIGQPPSGSRDPFGLRRAALGVIRIVIENELELSLDGILEKSASLFDGKQFEVTAVKNYILDRLEPWYQEQGIAGDILVAVKSGSDSLSSLRQIHQKVQHLHAFKNNPAADAITAANKRIANILKDEGLSANTINVDLFSEDAEVELHSQLEAHRSQIQQFASEGNYDQSLALLAELRPAIDAYFDHVMVNVDDEKTRLNRLAMLTSMRLLFLTVADFSKLQ